MAISPKDDSTEYTALVLSQTSSMADLASEVTSAPTIWERLRQHWDGALLLSVCVVLLGCLCYFFLPKPQATLAVSHTSVTAQQAPNVVGEFSGDIAPNTEVLADEKNMLKKKKRSKHFSIHKKPAHPPITSLNRANPEQLQLLPGVGPKMAERIIEYRKTHAGFKSLEEVMEVKGIGTKKFEKMKPYLKL